MQYTDEAAQEIAARCNIPEWIVNVWKKLDYISPKYDDGRYVSNIQKGSKRRVDLRTDQGIHERTDWHSQEWLKILRVLLSDKISAAPIIRVIGATRRQNRLFHTDVDPRSEDVVIIKRELDELFLLARHAHTALQASPFLSGDNELVVRKLFNHPAVRRLEVLERNKTLHAWLNGRRQYSSGLHGPLTAAVASFLDEISL